MTDEPVHWVQTFSGGAVDILTPDPAQMRLVDIAAALSHLPRFNGHTRFPWSVASHSLLVANLCPRDTPADVRLAALLHDAHEAVIGDIVTPVKQALAEMAGVCLVGRIAGGLRRAIHFAAGLGPFPPHHQTIATADRLALAVERRDLLTMPPRPWNISLPDITTLPLRLLPVTEMVARERFIARVHILSHEARVRPMTSFLEGLGDGR